MKIYGIEICEKDNTIGFRDKTIWTEWFESEESRNKSYQNLTTNKQDSLSDMLVEIDTSNSPYIDGHEVITKTYTKIEKYK